MSSSYPQSSNFSSASFRKSAKFSIGNDDSSTELDANSRSHNNRLLKDKAIQALEEAVSNIVVHQTPEPLLGVTGDKYFEVPTPFREGIGMVNIHRPIYSQSRFNKIFGENNNLGKSHRFFDSVFLPIGEKRNCCEIIYSLFPLIAVIKSYNFKTFFPVDLIAGLTTGVMRIPQSMAYAFLANVTPVFGLYTAFFSAWLYPVFGASNHMAAGAQGVVSLLIGGGVLRVLKQLDFKELCNTTSSEINFSNTSFNPCEDIILENKINIAITITFMAGIIQCLLGICRFGFLTNYLSDPLVGGYTTAAVCSVIVSQLPLMLGIKTGSFVGILNLWYLVIDTFEKIRLTNLGTLTISIVCLAFLSISKYLSSKLMKRIKIPFPGELIVMICTILFSTYTNAHKRWHIEIVGVITPGFQKPRLPDHSIILTTMEASISTAIVSFTIGYSISKSLAMQNDYNIDGNQEIFAFGFMNSVGSFFNCFAATASMSASCLNRSLGSVSQISNLIAGFLILLALLFLGPLFETTPECVLSTIILINVKSILYQFADLPVLWKVSKIDFLLWLVTFLAVIILDIDMGLGIGVIFSLLTIVFRTQWPYACLLGRMPSTDIYKNINLTAEAEEVPGIKIFRFEGSLYFASAEHFRNSIQHETGINPSKIINLRKERENKLLKVKMILEHDNRIHSESSQKIVDTSIIDLNSKEVHHIIIDFSTCSFIDSVGVKTITQVISDYKEAHIIIFLANVRAAVLAMLNNSAILYKTVNAKHIFLSVHDAILGALEDEQYLNERDYIIKDIATKSGTRCVSRIASDPEITQSYKRLYSDRIY